MLELILSRDRKENTEMILHRIRDCVQTRQSGQILVVPEQYSHDTERGLCECCGDTASLYAEVLSFTRLADRVFSIYGGICRETLDDGGRFTALTLALEYALPRLKVYAVARSKPELIVQLLQQIEEFKNCGVTAADLKTASLRFEGAFAQKLEELSLILESYDAVCAVGKADPTEKLIRLRDSLWESEFAKDKTFYFDGFSDFTGVQNSIMDVLFQLRRTVVVSLVCDDVQHGEFVFETAREAARQLIRLAEKNGNEIRIHTPEESDVRTAFLRRHLFSYDHAEASSSDGIVLAPTASPEEACDLVAAEVRRLLMRGYRCRDIAIACTDRELYFSILRPLLERCGVPTYFTGREDILREPTLQAILAALNSATRGMESEDVFSYLRSPIGTLPRDACDRMQNYVQIWRISGTQWQKPWTKHPDGFGKTQDAASEESLRELNLWREQAAGPLLRFKAELEQAANTEGQVRALYAFLQKTQAEEKLAALATALDCSDQRAQELGQLYDICLSAMDQMALVLGNTVRSPEDFAAMLRQLLGQYRYGTIPARLDAITVGDFPSLRYSHKKALLVLGADDGMLPQFSQASGILTEQERKLLETQAELRLSADQTGRMDREMATVYDVLCSGADYLYLGYAEETPSYLVHRLKLLYPEAEERRTAGPLLLCDRDAGGYLAACSDEDPVARMLAGLERPELMQAAADIRRRSGYHLGQLSDEAVTLLYHRVIQLSASKIDLFSACKCAYFLQYGLHAKEQKEAAVDAPIFGTFVHAVLEGTARQVQEKGGFSNVDDVQLQEITEREIARFTEEQIGTMAEQEPRFRYLFERNLAEVREVVVALQEELSRTDFEPNAYELDFRPGGTLPPITVEGEQGTANLVGFVDRVDLFHTDEADYLRVVDYKTGKKEFSYSDIENGMGMQMLVYLFALQTQGEMLWGGKIRPAGVLYCPARAPIQSSAEKVTPEEAEALRKKAVRRDGLLLDDTRILRAMENFTGQPDFLPCKVDKEGNFAGNLVNHEQMKLLKTHVEETLRRITDEIFSGEVQPNPYFQGRDKSACKYCGFASICHMDSCDPNIRVFSEQTAAEFWKRLEERHHG